ncbi:MAG: hypothetical protein HY231_26765 [Acidobacteria bacterium]|nr:hypothetical protein [Acidobacteriota bacterium]
MLKSLKFAIVILAISLFVGLSLSRQTVAHTAQQVHRSEIIGMGASMNERLGADDHPAFVVHFTGELHGSLETCG